MKKILLLLLLCPLFVWSQVQIGIDIDGESSSDRAGIVSLSTDGSIVAIGSFFNDGNGSNSGHVRVFENQSGTWVQVGNDMNGEAANDQSGGAVSISGDGSIVAIGAKRNDGNGDQAGHVRVYENVAGSWTQIGNDIDGEAQTDLFGTSVSLSTDGSILAIGAELNDGNGEDAGHVRVFENQAGSWVQIGDDIDGEAAGDKSGFSVSLSGDGTIVAIGAYSNQGNGSDSGHVRIYENQAGTWSQLGGDIDGEASSDLSGDSVSLSSDGSIVAIGAKFNDGFGLESGHVRVYENQSGSWVQLGNDIDGESAGDRSGESVSLSDDGTIVAIGATDNNGNGVLSGQVRVYQNQSGTWTQIGNDIDGETAVDLSGASLSISGDGNTLAIGALLNDGNGDSSGHVRVFDISATLSVNNLEGVSFSFYPNPVRDELTINLENSLEFEQVNVYDINGQFINSSKHLTLDFRELSSGLYFLEVETNKGKLVKKIIVE